MEMVSLRKGENAIVRRVKPVYLWLGFDLLVSVVLQDQLLEEQEGSLVIDLLPDLHAGLPGILRGQPGTLRTLGTLYDKSKDESLLQDRSRQDFLLDDNLQLKSTRMRFGPEERGVDQPDSRERFGDLFETDS
jgi:hypothetical protein